MMKKNKKNITFVIHPTIYKDYDILAIGEYHLLRQLALKVKYFHLIKKSRFGGIPILILDTSDTLREALTVLKEYKKLYGLNGKV